MLRLLEAFAGPGLVTRVECTMTRDSLARLLRRGRGISGLVHRGRLCRLDSPAPGARRPAARSLVHRYVELNRAPYRVDPRALDAGRYPAPHLQRTTVAGAETGGRAPNGAPGSYRSLAGGGIRRRYRRIRIAHPLASPAPGRDRNGALRGRVDGAAGEQPAQVAYRSLSAARAGSSWTDGGERTSTGSEPANLPDAP